MRPPPSRPEPRVDVALMSGYHSPQLDVKIRLNTNESPVPPPDGWRQAVADETATIPWHRYPDRAAGELRAALARHHGTSPDMVFAANGSNEVLQSLCLAYAGAGRSVAVFEPTYTLHSHIARLTGAAVAAGERRDDFTLDVDEVRRVVTTDRPAITLLCSPNNPTGMVEPEAVVRALLADAPGLLVVDEAYGQFAPWTAVDLVDDDVPLVVTRTYSKTWATAGLRLGYCVAPTWVVDQLDKVALPYHLDAFKQVAGRLALDYEAEMRARVAGLVEERGRVYACLTELDVDVWPSAANFILFRPRHRSSDDVWAALVDRSILIRNCSSWPRLDGCLRVSIGTPDENDAFLTALTEIL
ncbi:MAG: histidinol-phosphate transaminase [Acidimicrobiales bacterium]